MTTRIVLNDDDVEATGDLWTPAPDCDYVQWRESLVVVGRFTADGAPRTSLVGDCRDAIHAVGDYREAILARGPVGVTPDVVLDLLGL